MAISKNLQDRERDKFVESLTRPGFSAVEVVGNLTTSGGQFSIPSNSTCYTYETGTDSPYFTESYKFYESGTPAAPVTLIKTITLYYTDSNRTLEFGGVVG